MGHKQSNGVHRLVRNTIPSGLLACVSTTEPSILWHYRLGHPSYQKLQQALPWVSVSHFDCESCQRGKHTRATFRSLHIVSSKTPFELVHCDVWSPSHVSSILGHKYYIIFVDDYSRVSWIYVLKDRLHVLDIVERFFVEIKKINFLLLQRFFLH